MSSITRRNAPTNWGQRAGFPVVPAPGGFASQNTVQLISARIDQPKQWIVTLATMTRRATQVVPWTSPFDGVAGAAITGTLPQFSFPAQPFRVKIAWGAGGVRGEAQFDYPMAGGTFSIVADTLDLTVFNPLELTTAYPTIDDVPVFGAFMVEGSPSNAVGMTWGDVFGGVQGVGVTANWAVKPYARNVWITQGVPANAAVLYAANFFDGSGLPLWGSSRMLDGTTTVDRIPVPGGALLLTIQNLTAGGGGQRFRPLWEMFFS